MSEATALWICWSCRSDMQNGRRRRQGREGGSRTHTSLPEQEVGIFLQGSRSPSPVSELQRSPQEEPGTSPPQPRTRAGPARTPQSHGPAATAGAVRHHTRWGTYFSSLSSPHFAKSLFYPEAQTYFIAPSLLPLKPEKHYFQNSREKNGGWGLKVLAWNIYKVGDMRENMSWL